MSAIKETLALLKRYQIIALVDTLEDVDGHSKIIVYPTVNVMMMGDDVKALLKEFEEEGEDENDNESEI